MNGKYEIDEQTYRDMPVDKQNWMMFQTFNGYRDVTDKRICKLEKRKKIDTGVAATTGVLGGALALMAKWFFFKGA